MGKDSNVMAIGGYSENKTILDSTEHGTISSNWTVWHGKHAYSGRLRNLANMAEQGQVILVLISPQTECLFLYQVAQKLKMVKQRQAVKYIMSMTIPGQLHTICYSQGLVMLLLKLETRYLLLEDQD